MYNIDYSKIKKHYFYCVPILIAGFIMLIGFTFMIVNPIYKSKNYKGEVKAFNTIINTSTNDEGNITYSPTYEYMVNGNVYKCKSNVYTSFSSGMKEKNTIYYDLNNPTNCVSEYYKDVNFIDIIILILPLSFILFGAGFILSTNKKIKKLKYLSKFGKLVNITNYRIIDSNVIVNHKRLPLVEINYEFRPNEFVMLKSEPFSNDKFNYNSKENIKSVELIIDPMDKTNYYIKVN